MAWSPDGKRLATGSQDETTKVWLVASGQEVLTLQGHSRIVESVDWRLDGRRLATASADKTVQVYAMDVHDLMSLARKYVSAYPSEESCQKYFHVDKCPLVPELPLK